MHSAFRSAKTKPNKANFVFYRREFRLRRGAKIGELEGWSFPGPSRPARLARMRNKANLRKGQMELNAYTIKDYVRIGAMASCENKANSNPIWQGGPDICLLSVEIRMIIG